MPWTILAALLLALAGPAGAQDEPDDVPDPVEVIRESARAYTPAKVLERPPPSYPVMELRRAREAWIEVSYCIDESGTPQNITVLDSAGSRQFEKAAINAVQDWRFEPAKVDGQPVWQSNNQSLITFAIETDVRGGDPKIGWKLRKLGKLIDEGKVDEADTLFQDLFANDTLNLYELAKIWTQRVRYEFVAGDLHTAHLALHRAGASSGEFTDKESYAAVLRVRTMVELRLGYYPAALSTYRKLVKQVGEDDPAVAELRPTIENVRELLASDTPLSIEAEVRTRDSCYGCDNSYYFLPVRRQFTFTDIEGELHSIEIRCDRKRYESAIADGVQWHIPESWGDCSIEVYGEPGTTFNLIALPDDPQS